MEYFLWGILTVNLSKTLRWDVSAPQRRESHSLCLSLSGSAAKRAKEKPGLSVAHILLPGLKCREARHESQVTTKDPGELGAEFGVGDENRPGVLHSWELGRSAEDENPQN